MNFKQLLRYSFAGGLLGGPASIYLALVLADFVSPIGLERLLFPAGVAIASIITAAIVYSLAESEENRVSSALLAFCLVPVSAVVGLVLLGLFFVLVVCRFTECRLFPFL